MFDKLKDLNNLRKAQSQIKKQLEQIYVTEEKRGYKVRIRGDKKIESIEYDGDAENIDLNFLAEFLNDVFKQVDKKVEKQMRGQMGDLGFPGL